MLLLETFQSTSTSFCCSFCFALIVLIILNISRLPDYLPSTLPTGCFKESMEERPHPLGAPGEDLLGGAPIWQTSLPFGIQPTDNRVDPFENSDTQLM